MLLLGMTQVQGDESQDVAGMLGLDMSEAETAAAQDPQAAAQMQAEMLEAAGEKVDEMPDSIVTQAAVAFVQAEYEAMGTDMDAVQMDYIKKRESKCCFWLL